MGKEGKVDVLSVLIASIVIFVVSAVFVLGLGGSGVYLEFPVGSTNASASAGYADAGLQSMTAFNGTNPLFKVNISINSTANNVTNVSIYVDTAEITNIDVAVPNLTQYINDTTTNQIINFTLLTLGEGTYFWAASVGDNGSTAGYNTTLNGTFIIDKTSPGFSNISGNLTVVNTSNTALATEDTIYFSVNVSDALTSIKGLRLFVNISGTADNEVNTTGGTSGVTAGNGALVNLSYKIPGNQIGQVLNFTFQANDSVNNINITPALIYLVEGDGTVPGPINLLNPINLFNTSSVGVLQFNFSATDNNDTNFNCDINISRDGLIFESIAGLNVTSGVHHLNSSTTTFTDGTYSWSVNCTDGVGNFNMSTQVNTFTVDQIPPALTQINITNSSSFNGGIDDVKSILNSSGSGQSILPGQKIYLTVNLTDNLTQPANISFQWLNATDSKWREVNITPTVDASAGGYSAAEGMWGNASFTIPTGRNEFEGKNVSFRVVYNDTLENSNTSATLIVQVNDTYAPTITINATDNGGVMVNGSNITNTRPLISWVVDENNKLTSINISVDGTLPTTGVDGCSKSAFYSETLGGVNNVEVNRNRSFQIVSPDLDTNCPLGNGSHTIEVRAKDIWGNQFQLHHTFSIQSGSVPGLQFNLTNEDAAGTWIKAVINNSNITSSVGVTLFGTNGAGSIINKISYHSSCDSTTRVESNNTVVYPFNASSCSTLSENRTLTVTINDTAGNSNTTVLGFLVDNVVPTLTVNHPTEGRIYTDIESIFNLTVLDNDQAISSLGYYLDESLVPTVFNISGAIGGAGVTTTQINTTNLTRGTHTIKFTVNDTLGNIFNGSVITFTQDGPIEFLNINASLEDNIRAYYNANISNGTGIANISIRQKTDAGTYSDITVTNGSSNTYEILYQINGTTNVTLTEINGSAANWGKLNIVPVINDTRAIAGIQNNWTNTVLSSVVFNNSLGEFITNNNSYHGVVLLPLNISGNTSTAQQLWWIKDEGTLTTRTNISQCTVAFTRTNTIPCWNYTSNGKTIIQVPHFSVVAAVNDSSAPTVNVTTPQSASHTVSMFQPNITVSADTASCVYSADTTDGTTNKTMTMSGNLCLGETERFKNNNSVRGNHNFTYFITDLSGNSNTYIWSFNVSDNTAPNNGLITVSSTGETTATIKITGANESVNATIMIANGSSTIGNEEDFNVTQSVSITGLSASTTYFYNVTVCDFNGNCKTNSTVSSFITSAVAATTTTTTTTGGGGGAAVVSKVVDSKAQVWNTIPVGSSISMNVDKVTIAITKVVVNNVKSGLKSVDLEVAALKENPVSTVPAPTVYQYLRINKKNLKNTDAEGFKVGFRVTKSWLTANNMASGDIALYRYKSGWNQLTTRVIGTDEGYVNYEADTPGFSSFAIGVRTVVEAPEVAPGVPGAPTVPTAPTAPTAPERVVPVPPPEAVEMPEPVEAPSKAPAAWLIAVVVVIIGIVLIVMYQRRKNQV